MKTAETAVVTVEMEKKSDHGGSVRFDAAKVTDGPPPGVANVYVSRAFVAINSARVIRVTVEVVR